MEIPKIGKGKYLLLNAELSTGIVLNKDGSYYNKDVNYGTDVYSVSDSLQEAYDKANKIIKENPKIEVVIYDSSGTLIEVVRNN